MLKDGAAGDPAAPDALLAFWTAAIAAGGWLAVASAAYAGSRGWPGFGDLRAGMLCLLPWALAYGWAHRARRARRRAGAAAPAVDLAATAVAVNSAAVLPVAVAAADALAKSAI